MGFIDSSPSPTRLPLRPLPDEPSLTLRSGTARSQTRSVLAVPPGSDGLLRSETRSEDLVPWQLAGLLHPAADRGVRPVSGFLESEDSAARHPGGARFQKPSSQAQTLRSVPLPGSSLPSPRSPAFTGKHCPPVVDPIHRVATLNRTSTSRPLLHRGVRSRAAAFPPRPSRCSHGLWIDAFLPATHTAWAGSGPPPARPASQQTRGAFPGPESPGKAKFLGFVWLRGPMLSPLPGGRDDRRLGSARNPKTAALSLPPTPFGAGWSLARWPDPKIEPWPRRRRLPEGTSDDSTAAPKNRRHHRSRCTRKCLDSGQPPAPPEGGPDDLQDPSARF